MARQPRLVVAGVPHHVTHRGNRRGAIFLERGDQDLYCSLMRLLATRFGVQVWAYCLMPNHVHLLLVPPDTASLAIVINRAHSRYARIVNQRHDWTGHLFANRFYSSPLDETHLWYAAKYIELNPVRGGLVTRADQFPWSSAPAHIRGQPDPLLSPHRPFPGPVEDWGTWLASGLPDAAVERIRQNTRTGRPTGDSTFVDPLTAGPRAVKTPRPRGPTPLWNRDGQPSDTGTDS